MNNNNNTGLAVRNLGMGVPKYVEAATACGWPEAGAGFSAILWLRWLNEQWVTLANPDRQATLRMLRERALGELAVFQRRARATPPVCQILCAGLAAESSFGKSGDHHPGAWGLCDPALLYLPRVVSRRVTDPPRRDQVSVEEGIVSMRALCDSSWHADFIVRRALERGWHRIWVGGSERFVEQITAEARPRGVAVHELMTSD